MSRRSKRIKLQTPVSGVDETASKRIKKESSGSGLEETGNAKNVLPSSVHTSIKTEPGDVAHTSPITEPDQKPQPKKMTEQMLMAELKQAEKKSKGLLKNVGLSWFPALQPELSKPYFIRLVDYISGERKKHKIYPPADEVFIWTQLCEINEVKVVILGPEDPHRQPWLADGLCFSRRKGFPLSNISILTNIFRELADDIEDFQKPDHGDLTGWAEQGVLLLNGCLTVRGGKSHQSHNHHYRGWEKLIDAVIEYININLSGVVFILWGSYAQAKGTNIDQQKHCVMKEPYPGGIYLYERFLGSKPFSRCNKYLEEHGKEPIDWSHLP